MFDISKVKTPCYVVDEAKLLKNLTILDNVMEKTGCKILLAQKAFSMYSTYPMISQHLKGTTASGLYEAKDRKSTRLNSSHPSSSRMPSSA